MYLFTTVRYKKTLKLGYFSRIAEICSTALTAKLAKNARFILEKVYSTWDI